MRWRFLCFRRDILLTGWICFCLVGRDSIFLGFTFDNWEGSLSWNGDQGASSSRCLVCKYPLICMDLGSLSLIFLQNYIMNKRFEPRDDSAQLRCLVLFTFFHHGPPMLVQPCCGRAPPVKRSHGG